MEKIKKIFINAIPVLIMILLIPFIKNDYLLTCLYIIIMIISFSIKKEKNDLPLFVFGFLFMTISESLFISTGVEKFQRISFLGIMPVWLPFLWAYGFVAIKRAVGILDA